MLLQQVSLTENTNGLYSHSRGLIEIKEYENDSSVIFGKGAEWASDAYLNAFSIGKWCTYCDLKRISLHLKLQGVFIVRVFYAYMDHRKFCRKQIAGGRVEASEGSAVEYDIPMQVQGAVYFSLKALTDGAVCSGASFEGETDIERTITIALNICTYRREKELLRNLELLRKSFLENKESALYGHLQVFITDNGNTLPMETLQDDNVHICGNPNVGGAGGFARGLIEIDRIKQQKSITHVIFMDDDVEILPEGITRTYRMLRCLRDRYQSAFIAGAMLRLDEKYIQHENGAVWNSGKCRFVGRGLDLRKFSNIVQNEQEQERDYAAWWYCCVPVETVRKDNLPIPVFLHGDDVEYSLRNARGMITMNGISVWHPAAVNRRVSSNAYYNLRNMLIVNAKYCPAFGRRQMTKTMAARLLMPLLRYRYKDMHLVYQALVDFCRGPEWLLQADAAAYHQKIVDMGYQMTDVSEKLKCGKTRAFSMGVNPLDLCRTGKVILYDDASMQGIEVRRSFRQIFVWISLYIRSLKLIYTKYDKSKLDYQAKWDLLQDIGYWGKLYEQ